MNCGRLFGALTTAAFLPFLLPAADAVNLALGKTYRLSPRPNYSLCTDDDDRVQLTDGFYRSSRPFWESLTTVGWANGSGTVSVTVDLGECRDIGGFSWNTAGGAAGVPFPNDVNVFVSDDGNVWRFVADIWGLACRRIGAPPDGRFAAFRAEASGLPCRGRYVRFVTHQPTYSFVDEVEVFAGTVPPGDGWKVVCPIVEDTLTYGMAGNVRRGMIRRDAVRLSAPESLLRRIDEEPENAYSSAVLPLTPVHAEVWSLNARRLQAAGWTKPVFWENDRWENLDPLTVPSQDCAVVRPVEIFLMRGETRSETINLLNPEECEQSWTVSVEGLPESLDIDIREVLYTATYGGKCVAGALKPGNGRFVRTSVPAGASRQLWIYARKPCLKEGVYDGKIVARREDGKELEHPFRIRVYGLNFPARPRLHIGGWDYVNGGNRYYGSPDNLSGKMREMREMFVDSPWATAQVSPCGARFDAVGDLQNVAELDFGPWNKWTALWPDARMFCVFYAGGKSFNGEKAGTPRFSRMVGSYFRAWNDYVRKTRPDATLVVHSVDEPRNADDVKVRLSWDRAIRAGAPEIRLYNNPIFRNPADADPEMYRASDIVCPHVPVMNLGRSAPFYRNLQAEGKELWLYGCIGPSREFDPTAYYRAYCWLAFQMDAKACHWWAFGSGGGSAGSWRPFEQTGVEYSPFFVSPTDAMSAKQSEGIREGVEDYEYLALLSAAAKAAKTRGQDVRQADALLREAPQRVLGQDADGGQSFVAYGSADWNASSDRSIADRERRRILEALVDLKARLRRKEDSACSVAVPLPRPFDVLSPADVQVLQMPKTPIRLAEAPVVPEGEIIPGRYRFYRLDPAVYAAALGVRMPEPGWDFYASLRFSGPAYDCGDRTGVSEVMFKRAILVRQGALPSPSAVDLAFAGTDAGYRLPPGVSPPPPIPPERMAEMATAIPPLPPCGPIRYRLEDGYGLTGRLSTARCSLDRCLGGRVSVALRRSPVDGPESYRIDRKEDGGVVLTAGDDEGMRRAVYAFIRGAASGTFRTGARKPWLKDRISRCFFAPIRRPPVYRDELADDIDRYHDAYLERLAYEGVNGLWISTSLRDLAETTFDARRPGAERKIEKLRRIVAQCSRYGIGIWLFSIEPSLIAPDDPLLARHPELMCEKMNLGVVPCPSNPAMRRFVRETTASVFAAVQGLAGLIDITYGEWPTSCLEFLKPDAAGRMRSTCPRCSDLEPWQIHQRSVESLVAGMRVSSPSARLVSWFYYPSVQDEECWVADVARHQPAGVSFQFNFESGAEGVQLGKLRRGGDYWLSFPGPGKPFEIVSAAAREADVPLAAKIQTGCSHELATLPYVPVPGLLYRKFKAMHTCGVSTAMLNWYFGNAPGTMQEVAGLLAFSDFSENEHHFLEELARPVWGDESETVVSVWERCADAYRQYPLSNGLQYYGPFHAGVVWPLLPDVSMAPLARSWSAGEAPSGDLIAECFEGFSLEELCTAVSGMNAKLVGLKDVFGHLQSSDLTPARRQELSVFQAFCHQFAAAEDVFSFYGLRAEAVHASRVKRDMTAARRAVSGMRAIVRRACEGARQMRELSSMDVRLGYHGEAESHLYYPAAFSWRLGELARADRRLEEIDAVLASGSPYPESTFEVSSPTVTVGGPSVDVSGGSFRVTENPDGALVVSGALADETEVLVNVADATGTYLPRAVTCPVKDGRFRLDLSSDPAAKDSRRPAWLLLRSGSGGRFLWPDGFSRVRYRMCLDPVEGDFFGRMIRKGE